jgi:hypothetical protein
MDRSLLCSGEAENMHLVAVAWIYVVVMMAVVEAASTQGSVLGAIFTVLLYGLLPLGIVLYVMGTPMRGRARRAAALAARAARPPDATHAAPTPPDAASAAAPDQGGHAAGDAVAAERKEI